ncbi:hypothetical protein BsWGS_06886 [Bradybaena similaris]
MFYGGLWSRVVKKGEECEQPDNKFTYFENKRAIQAGRRDLCQVNHDSQALDRRGQTIVASCLSTRFTCLQYRLHVSPVQASRVSSTGFTCLQYRLHVSPVQASHVSSTGFMCL